MSEALPSDQRVHISFPLLTDGKDPELDAISIVVECMRQLDGDQIGRILEYLTKRYTR
jgi:hypothetical protein